MEFKTKEQLEAMIENYENGNKADFRAELVTLNASDTAKLISLWQPYHSAIAIIQMSFEVMFKEVEKARNIYLNS